MTRLTTPLTFATWFHADDLGRAGTYAQLRGSSAGASAYEVYLRCVDVCMASFRRWNPAGRAVVVLNPDGAKSIGQGRARLWERMAVTSMTVPNTHRPKSDLFDQWQNQFFLFDVMRALLDESDPQRPIVVVDSDVVVRAPLDGLAREIVECSVVSMRIPYPEDEPANGSTRRELGEYAEHRLGRSVGFVPAYLGGEFVAATREALERLTDECDEVYCWSLDQQRAGGGHPHEEAHMISVARPTRESEATGNRWIERIWTKPWNLRLVPPVPGDIPLWHLPAEKKTGIDRLHAAVLVAGSWFWRAPDDVWLARTEQILGVPFYSPSKLLQDVVALRRDVPDAIRERLQR